MKGQFNLILALIFTLLIASFSVLNVDPVPVNFLISKTSIPLIIVIIGSALIGGVIVGSVGLFRQYQLLRQIKTLRQTVKQQLGEAALLEIDQTLKGKKLHTKPTEQDKHIEQELAKASTNTDTNTKANTQANNKQE